jgi:hypothetical protein
VAKGFCPGWLGDGPITPIAHRFFLPLWSFVRTTGRSRLGVAVLSFALAFKEPVMNRSLVLSAVLRLSK